MTAIRVRWPEFIRRQALPLWFIVWAPVGWLLGASPVVLTIYAVAGGLCWMCEREIKYLDAEMAALKAEIEERRRGS